MLGAAVGETVEISPLAPRSLWDVLSPNAGYPSEYGMGGEVDYEAFTNGMIGAADRIGRRIRRMRRHDVGLRLDGQGGVVGSVRLEGDDNVVSQNENDNHRRIELLRRKWQTGQETSG